MNNEPDCNCGRDDPLRLLTVPEAASRTGLSEATIRRAITEQTIKVVRIREGGHPRIPEAELLRLTKASQ